jgi:hypothetical protein
MKLDDETEYPTQIGIWRASTDIPSIGQSLRCDWQQGVPAWGVVSWCVWCNQLKTAWDKKRATDSSIVFAGKDASRALGKTSTKPEDVQADWHGLDDKEKETLNDWITFFAKRYNIVGVVEGAQNME